MMSTKRRQEIKARKQAEREALLKAHAAAVGPKRPRVKVFGQYMGPNLSPRAQERSSIKSLETMACATAKVEAPRYTGDKLLGVALMHKSNYVPVFKQEDAVAIAKMRRG